MKWVLRSSSVRVATSSDDRVYRSIQDAPAELQSRIRRAIEGPNAHTILIANQKAYDKIRQENEISNPEWQLDSAIRPPVISTVSAESFTQQTWRLSFEARRLLIITVAASGLLGVLWAVLIQIGR